MKRYNGELPFKAGYVGSAEYVICKGCPSIIAANDLRLAIMTDTPMTGLTGYKDTNWYHLSCFFVRERPTSVNDISDFHTLRSVHQDQIREVIHNYSRSNSTSTSIVKNSTSKSIMPVINKSTTRVSLQPMGMKTIINGSVVATSKITNGPANNAASTPTTYTHANPINVSTSACLVNTPAAIPNGTRNGLVSYAMSSVPVCSSHTAVSSTAQTACANTSNNSSSNTLTVSNTNTSPVSSTSTSSGIPTHSNHTIVPPKCTFQAIRHALLNVQTNNPTTILPTSTYETIQKAIIRSLSLPHTPGISGLPSTSTLLKVASNAQMGMGPTRIINTSSGRCLLAVRPRSTPQRPPPQKRYVRVAIPSKIQQHVLPIPNIPAAVNNTNIISVSNAPTMALNNAPPPQPPPVKTSKKSKRVNVAVTSVDPSHASYVPEPSTFVFQVNDISTARTVGLQVKNGCAVDHQSHRAPDASVYRDPMGNIYSAVLFRTDWEAETNSFHKIQVLECKQPGLEYWLFQSKGEIGSVGYLLDERKSRTLREAVFEFEKIFMEETGNMWKDRLTFKRIRGKKIMLDILYKPNVIVDDSEAPSQLVGPVQKFIKLIHQFGNTERELESVRIQTLDLEKWPVGRINDCQIQEAYGILQRLEDDVTDQERGEDDLKALIRSTNEYYSLIPRDFGTDKPRLLNSLRNVQKEIELLDSLMITETPYSLIDAYYEKLNAKLRPLGPEEVNFEIIKTGLLNTYDGNRIEIIEIFEVERFGEVARFTPYKDLPNKKLLWHGSRLVNFSKILAQGLCIAPHGAQISGHSFGRGIYFSDMVTKSVAYCRAEASTNNIGLLLLCEVALGNMRAVTKTAPNLADDDRYDSVKAVGTIEPDPKMNMELEDGIEIALGRGAQSLKGGSIMYNEYVVFNEAQVKIRYLVQAQF